MRCPVTGCVMVLLILTGCNRNEPPAMPKAAQSAERAGAPASGSELKKRIEVAEIAVTTEHPELHLSGRIAYGDDRFYCVSGLLFWLQLLSR